MYLSTAKYQCGLYSKYIHDNGSEDNYYEAVCYWNKTWSVPKHENCKSKDNFYIIDNYFLCLLFKPFTAKL